MGQRVSGRRAVLKAALAGAWWAGTGSWAAAAGRAPTTQAELDKMLKDLSNWGRWGNDDQRGTLNLITDAKRKEAAALVKEGISVSIAHTEDFRGSASNLGPIVQKLNKIQDDAHSLTDAYTISAHGPGHTHLDALCHFFYPPNPKTGKTYNGFPAEFSDKGCTRLGLEVGKDGFLTRGILFDIPALKGLPWLEPGTPVYPEELESWERKAGVKPRSGDAVILRTGRWAREAKMGPWSHLAQSGGTSAGFHASCGPWFKSRDVAVVGDDSVQDVQPSGVADIFLPVHSILLGALGMHVFDGMDPEKLAETCAKLNRWEFMFQAAPLVIPGATGMLLNPIATF